jgi:alpha-glucuronidase
LLLFMHHVPYRHALHSGKTVIQHVYDSHYSAAAKAAEFPQQWSKLHGKIDEERYRAGLKMLRYQAGYAVVWRDAVCNWFYRKSQIADAKGRVGKHSKRVEAEAMSLRGYVPQAIEPWEDASGGTAVTCPIAQCSAVMTFHGNPGWYEIGTQYFDRKTGASEFVMLLNGHPVDRWSADDPVPNGRSFADASARHTTEKIALRDGDQLQFVGTPRDDEGAMLDYIEVEPCSP